MKKFIFSLGLIAMMLNLTNCAQHDEVNPTIEPKGDFELYASISRTANDGLNTVWSAEDQINVFHAVANTTDYNSDGQFTLEDTATGRFLGNLNGTLESEAEYDWYAFYPYSQYYTTPANTDGGRVYIGSRSDAAQTQTGNNSMAHIAGGNYPMAGYASATPANEAPALVFKHVSSLIEFEVVNGLSEDITISKIEFTATEDIVGYYYINFADYNNLGFTKYNTCQSSTATLAVVDGTAITEGSSAKFYMAVKPFTAAANSELTINVSAMVDGNEYVYSKSITVAEATTFTAGKIKPVKVNYNVELSTDIRETIDFTAQGYANAQEITSFDGTYCEIEFNKGSGSNTSKYYTTGTAIRCYGGNIFTISSTLNIVKIEFTFDSGEGTNTITADSGTFDTNTWNGSASSVKFTVGGTSGHRRIQKMVITYGEAQPMIIASNPEAVAYNATTATIPYELLATTGTVTATEEADWITAVDCSAEGSVVLTLTENEAYTARTADVTLAKKGVESVVVKVTQNAKPQPTITLAAAAISVGADATTATINYTSANLIDAVTATVTEGDWIKDVDSSVAGEVTLTFDANSASEARVAKITLSSTDATSVVATVSQAAVSTGDEPAGEDISLVFNTADYTKKVSSYTTTWNHTYGGYEYSIVNFNNNNAGWSYIKCGSKNGTSIASINTTFAIPWSVANVTVTVDAVTTSKIKSTYLVVATDANFSNVVETVKVSIATGNVVYTITNPGANYYYKVVYDCEKGSSNGLVQISKVVYTAKK